MRRPVGERRVIVDPEAAVPMAGQTIKRRCSVRQQPVDDVSGYVQHLLDARPLLRPRQLVPSAARLT